MDSAEAGRAGQPASCARDFPRTAAPADAQAPVRGAVRHDRSGGRPPRGALHWLLQPRRSSDTPIGHRWRVPGGRDPHCAPQSHVPRPAHARTAIDPGKGRVPSTSMYERIDVAIRPGRSQSTTSMVITRFVPISLGAAMNSVPRPAGPSDVVSARTIRGFVPRVVAFVPRPMSNTCCGNDDFPVDAPSRCPPLGCRDAGRQRGTAGAGEPGTFVRT